MRVRNLISSVFPNTSSDTNNQSKQYLVARRAKEHEKGPKELMRIRLGDAIPKGVILGKGTIINIEA